MSNARTLAGLVDNSDVIIDTVDFVKFKVLDTTNSRVPFAIGSGNNAVTIENDTAVSQNHEYIALQEADSSLRFGTLGTERMRIDSSGHVIIPNGVTLGTAINSYGAANTLDDYEEGTWTPITGSGTWSVSQAQTVYTKVGRMVTCNFFITATSDVSAVDFTGLPFVPSTEAGGVCGYQTQDPNNVYTIYVQAANVWNIRQGSTQRGLSNNKTMRGTFSYITNS